MAGRPRVNIDWDELTNLLRAHCSGASIARLFNVHPSTLYTAVEKKYKCNFTEFAQEKKEEGISLVKLSMYNDAISGAHNGIDRIFWLKNCAGWKDKTETLHEGLPPTIQIAIAPNVDSKMSKQIENFFNGIIDDNQSIRKEPDRLQVGSETDN